MHKSSRSVTVSPRAPSEDTYQKTILDNGMRVVTETIPYVRSVSIGVWANVGSRDEVPDDNGISHFLEHMVFKGTKRRTVRDIARSLESLGGYLNAFTTKETTCFYGRVLDSHVEQAVDVLSDIVQHATFEKSELEKERLVVLEELKSAEDDPEDIIHDFFERAVFPSHSLGLPVIGTARNLRSFQREQLQKYVAHHYSSRSVVIAAAGNVDHRKLVPKVEKHFTDLREKVPRRVRTAPRGQQQGERQEYPRSIKQAHVCLGRQGYSIRHKDRYPLLLLNSLLGEGMSSRLYQTIREKYGLAYAVYSFAHMLSDTGIFGAYVGTDRKNVDNVIDLVHRELDRLCRRHVSKAELERTKSQMKGTMMLGLESMSSRMMRIGNAEIMEEDHTPLDTVLKRIDAVTPEGISRVARNLFDDKSFSTVIIHPS